MYGVDELADKYLKDRGFTISDRCPGEMPYLALCSTENSFDEYQVAMIGSGKATGIMELTHPRVTPADDLPGLVAGFVAKHMDDPVLGVAPGRPIPIFLADNAWQQTAAVLALAYPAKGEGR